MSALRALWARVRGSLQTARSADGRDEDLRAEMESHVALQADEYLRRGLSEDEAWRLARVAAGGVTQAAEAARAQQRLPLLEVLRTELGEALRPRVLRQHRTFSIAVILSLGAGISCAASVFALVESMRHGPLPFRNAERVVRLYLQHQSNGPSWEIPSVVLPAIEGASSPLSEVASFRLAPLQLRTGEHLARTWGMETTSNLLTLIGVRALLGRTYTMNDAGDAPSVVLSENFWTSELAADSSIVGRTIEVNGIPRVVLGVVARETVYPERTDVWLNNLGPRDTASRPTSLGIVALVRPGTDVAEARAWIATRGTAALLNDNPRRTVRVASMGLRDYLVAEPLGRVASLLTIVAVFMGLITAVNFAALMLARGIRRRTELGVRAALGASVPRLVRQLVGECLMLCAIGGALAALLAPATFALIRGAFAELMPAWLTISLGWRTIGASVALSVAIGMIFGLGPAIDIARPALTGFIRNAGATATNAAALVRTRSRLVAIQVALAVAIVVGVGTIFGKNLIVGTPDSGFDVARIVRGGIADSAFARPVDFATNQVGVIADARRISGVENAGLLEWQYGDGRQLVAIVDGETRNAFDAGMPLFTQHRVSETFFDVMRPRVISGRLPRAEELRRGDDVAVITKRVAADLFGGDAVGRRIIVSGPNGMQATVVGVIDDIRERVFAATPPPMVFTPIGPRNAPVFTMHRWELWIRATGSVPPLLRAAQIRAANHQLGTASVYGVESMAAMRQRDLYFFRSVERMILGMFVVALALAALGIYGLVAYTAEMRSRELAIREALGAGRVRIALQVMRGALSQTVAGAIGGAILATLLVDYLSQYQLDLTAATGPTTFAFVVIGLTVFVASSGPLVRMWRRDLALALRVD